MEAATPGRQNQKERTRRAIVAAAADLVAEGTLPSMPEVAERALVSVATAYRYFPDQLSLLSAAMQDGYSGASERFQPDIGDEPDVTRRVDIATQHLLHRISERETLVRAVIALSLLRSVGAGEPRGDAPVARPAFRQAWIDEALRPAEGALARADMRRLTLALGAVMSSEALVALKDVMHAEHEEAIEVCRWMARTLTAAALAQGRTGKPD